MAIIRIDMQNQKNYKVDSMPEFKRVRVINPMPNYMYNCVVNEEPHPLGIDTMDEYIRTLICEVEEDATGKNITKVSTDYRLFSNDEIDRIRNLCHRPEIEWAITNSFDGLYVAKCLDTYTFRSIFRLMVYLKGPLASYWRLKYDNL